MTGKMHLVNATYAELTPCRSSSAASKAMVTETVALGFQLAQVTRTVEKVSY